VNDIYVLTDEGLDNQI